MEAQSVADAVNAPGLEPRTFDFRNPGRAVLAGIRRLESAHDAFVSGFERMVGARLGTQVRIQLRGIDQLALDQHLQTTTPAMLARLDLAPYPGAAVFEIGETAGLSAIDVMLGGNGRDPQPRKPTDLDQRLLSGMVEVATSTLRSSLEPLGVELTMGAVETDPTLFALSADPGFMVALRYGVAIGEDAPLHDHLLLAYPVATIQAIAEGDPGAASELVALEGGEPGLPATVEDHLPDVPVPFAVRLQSTEISFGDIADLRPGDVLRLDHTIDEPALGLVDGRPLVVGRLGRRRNRLAIELSRWLNT